jgi:outer membrane protein OmpA-like peptidoglycan-associated protein
MSVLLCKFRGRKGSILFLQPCRASLLVLLGLLIFPTITRAQDVLPENTFEGPETNNAGHSNPQAGQPHNPPNAPAATPTADAQSPQPANAPQGQPAVIPVPNAPIAFVLRDTPFPAIFPPGHENFANLDELLYKALRDAVHSCHGTITLTGHTDAFGIDEANAALGRRRAQIVKARLVADGIPENHISISSAGSTKPIADNSTEEGRLANRRVTMTCNPS